MCLLLCLCLASVRGERGEEGARQEEDAGEEQAMMTCEEAEEAADLLKGQGEYAQAAAAWVSIIEACGESASRYSTLGVCQWSGGQLQEAEESFLAALRLDPSRATVVSNLASMQFMGGKFEEAAETAKKCLSLASEQDHLRLHTACSKLLTRCKDAQQMRTLQERNLAKHRKQLREQDPDGVVGLEAPESEGGGECSSSRDGQLLAGACPADVEERLAMVRDGTAPLSSVGPKFGNVQEVDVRDADSFTYEEFEREFVAKRRAVRIRGLLSRVFKDMSIDRISDMCGDAQVDLKTHDRTSSEGTFKLKTAEWARLGDYVAERGRGLAEGKMVFDYSIPTNCPEVLSSFSVPSYFARDYFQNLTRPVMASHENDPHPFSDSWPSLFIGPPMSGGGLHIDAFQTQFWMVVLEGKKLWQFFDLEFLPYLYPDPTTSILGVDTVRPDYDAHPLYAYASSFVCIVEPGDGLYVPSGIPHQVTNLSPTSALSMNFIDDSNLGRASAELAASADPEQARIGERLTALKDAIGAREGGPGERHDRDLTWGEFARLN